MIAQFIESYKECGSWYKVAEEFPEYNVALISNRVEEYLGSPKYRRLLQEYSRKLPETIVVPKDILNESIELYRFLRSWEDVADVYGYSSKTLTRRIIEYMGLNNYNALLEKYPYKIEIPESILRQMINKYIETPSWVKVSEDYDDYSLDIIYDRIQEYLGQDNYIKLRERARKRRYIDEYDPIFYEESFRIRNAWQQIVKINNGYIESISQYSIPDNWDDFYLFLCENNDWKFVDFLTGELIDIVSVAELHHNDGNKKNNDSRNLFYLLKQNHGLITSAQKYWKDLAIFFENLLLINRNSILKSIIPESWKIGWKELALRQGFTFPKGKYIEEPREKILFLDSFRRRIF